MFNKPLDNFLRKQNGTKMKINQSSFTQGVYPYSVYHSLPDNFHETWNIGVFGHNL